MEDQTPISQLILGAVETAVPSNVFGPDVVARVIDFDPWRIEHGVASDPGLRDPVASALCHATAKNLLSFIGEAPEPISFTPDPSRGSTPKELTDAWERVVEDIVSVTRQRAKAIYRIEYANHEFVVVAAGSCVEVLGSFQGAYSVGDCLWGSRPFEVDILEEALENLLGTSARARAMQRLLFHVPLDATESRAAILNYEKWSMKSGTALTRSIDGHLRKRLDAYSARAHREKLESSKKTGSE